MSTCKNKITMKKENDLARKANLQTESTNTTDIENMIFNIRGQQVMLDRDLAKLYGVETKVLNQAVKRNLERFPERFRFQLTVTETDKLVTNCDRLENLKHSTVCPFVFTEQGVAMLSSVLRSQTAAEVSVHIMDAFVAMRRFIASNANVFQRLATVEQNQLAISAHQIETDNKLNEVFNRLDAGNQVPAQGIFFDGQIFDAYSFVCNLVRIAKNSIILFDNYIDDTVLLMLDKREKEVSAHIYTKKITPQLRTDLNRHNAQYQPIIIEEYANAHDRFLCIDNQVYHIGASLKDLGKKWFAFSKMEIETDFLVQKVQQI